MRLTVYTLTFVLILHLLHFCSFLDPSFSTPREFHLCGEPTVFFCSGHYIPYLISISYLVELCNPHSLTLALSSSFSRDNLTPGLRDISIMLWDL